ncbi:NAD(P)/FAD-dependent oxidoreductase [Brachyspira murdochii]|uniref:NAD(P)/FAD-dependent oxidoreductase n=1 Tax=Brachyspira TaxID=29521 RepID=UPI0026F14505|nr:NAD(P)/FAD-dependent oxidoreductase [Brachyspira innocens]
MYDILIIGAGVSGTSSARELSRYKASICVVERGEDVCSGTSKSNSGIVHAGFDAANGSLMAKLNVLGNKMMPKIAEDLDVPFKQNGSLVVCTNEEDIPNLKAIYERGIKNGVEGLQILNREEVHKKEPNLNDNVCAALYAPTGGIVDPFILNIAYAENAYANGAEFKFNTEVINIKKLDDGTFEAETNNGPIKAKYIVNAAGVYADKFHNMMSKNKIHITPRRGDYILLDKEVDNLVTSTIFALPTKLGKGILVTPTAHGNIMLGPTAIDIEDKEGLNTTAEGLAQIIEKSKLTVKNIPYNKVITSFCGLRPHEDNHEFIIKELEDCEGFFDCAGIESPGLVSSPAIGVMVADIVSNKGNFEKKENFIEKRKGITHFNKLSNEEKNKLIKENPLYGHIICRCEKVTEGEIVEAIKSPIGAKSLDGVKRRVRAGLGRCQGGFCSPKIIEILARELNVSPITITKCGKGSEIVVGYDKETF